MSALLRLLRALRLCMSKGDGQVSGSGYPCPLMVETFLRCLSTAQETTRTIGGGERATVSLRDVSRCIKVGIEKFSTRVEVSRSTIKWAVVTGHEYLPRLSHVVEGFLTLRNGFSSATEMIGRTTTSLPHLRSSRQVFIWLGRMWVEHGEDSLLGDSGSAEPRTLAGFFRCRHQHEKKAVRKAIIMAMAYSYQARMER